jgi:hypothetical protein
MPAHNSSYSNGTPIFKSSLWVGLYLAEKEKTKNKNSGIPIRVG